jgi:hypothetical protein
VGLAVRPRWRRAAWSASFALGYALNVAWRCQGRVGLECIRSCLQSAFPQARVVGDKDPEYVFQLDAFAASPELKCIVIFRDCRDVVSSTLAKAATAWKKSRFVNAMDTPTKVATRWVHAIAQQERNAGAVLAVRYEDLVTQPGPTIVRLGEFLGLDAAGFKQKLLRPTSIGKHRGRLSAEALADIEAVAGDTMRRLGYV